MRIFKGLENIHAVIDRHDNEWRREQGEEEVTPFTPDEKIRKAWEKVTKKGKGDLDEKRFLNKGKKAKETEPEEDLPEQDTPPEVEIVEAIKQEGVQHSWLYNEVEKAVRAAVADDRRHTKVIAIFVPVIQSSKEFEELPVDESTTLPPVEEEIPEEDSTMPFEIDVEENEPDEVVIIEKTEETPETLEPSPIENFNDEEISQSQEQEPELESGEIMEDIAEEEHHDFNLLPEGQEHPDEELAEAFNAMEEKLAATSETESEVDFDSGEIPEEAEPLLVAEEQQEDPFRGESETEIAAEEEFNIENSELGDEIVEEFEEDAPAEAMSFEEFPVIKDSEAENDDTNIDEVPVDDFLEEVAPETPEELEEVAELEVQESSEESEELSGLEEFADEISEESVENAESIESDNETENESEEA
ncbi:MAG: hypothetical protein IJ597_02070, partial [Synergistaceae bacterium]|nr:hypothetical protein [Synergistaceae bacterium]